MILRKGGNLLIKLTGRTHPGKYTIMPLCTGKYQQVDAISVKTVRIYKLIGGFRQPDPSALPKHFKPDVTVNSGPPAKPPRKKKGH